MYASSNHNYIHMSGVYEKYITQHLQWFVVICMNCCHNRKYTEVNFDVNHQDPFKVGYATVRLKPTHSNKISW